MKATQFSVRDLLWALTLIAISAGVASIVHSLLHGSYGDDLLLAMPFLGAGMAAPFRQKRLGAYVGLFVGLMIFATYQPSRHLIP